VIPVQHENTPYLLWTRTGEPRLQSWSSFVSESRTSPGGAGRPTPFSEVYKTVLCD
ncbi:uncharacterized protein METZ01_LOCUS55713, partial [marine metagenome]